MHVLILITSPKTKSVGSTPGMKLTVETSELFSQRIKKIVPNRC